MSGGDPHYTHRVVDTPHEHAENGLARTEQLDFLSYKMLLFRLGFAGADGRRAGAVGCHVSGAGNSGVRRKAGRCCSEPFAK